MFLQHSPSGALVEVMSLDGLFNPTNDKVKGRFHAGEEMQDSEYFTKTNLAFPSGEALPQCWLDIQYRSHQKAH